MILRYSLTSSDRLIADDTYLKHHKHETEIRQPADVFTCHDSDDDGNTNRTSSGTAKRNINSEGWLLARHVQDRVSFVRMLFQLLDGVCGWQN